jgi:hypothetical protein
MAKKATPNPSFFGHKRTNFAVVISLRLGGVFSAFRVSASLQ